MTTPKQPTEAEINEAADTHVKSLDSYMSDYPTTDHIAHSTWVKAVSWLQNYQAQQQSSASNEIEQLLNDYTKEVTNGRADTFESFVDDGNSDGIGKVAINIVKHCVGLNRQQGAVRSAHPFSPEIEKEVKEMVDKLTAFFFLENNESVTGIRNAIGNAYRVALFKPIPTEPAPMHEFHNQFQTPARRGSEQKYRVGRKSCKVILSMDGKHEIGRIHDTDLAIKVCDFLNGQSSQPQPNTISVIEEEIKRIEAALEVRGSNHNLIELALLKKLLTKIYEPRI